MLLHLGAQRTTSARLRNLAGSKGGFSCMGDRSFITPLCRLLDALEQKESLPSTVLFNLNPSFNPTLATLTGSFAEDNVAGKIQFGPAWWYNDHKDGIEKHLMAIANHGLLNHFIGMTTDSRSILSLSRHDYFRRVVCNLIGSWIEAGEIPNDSELLETMMIKICYQNAKKAIKKRNSQDEN